LINYRVQEEDKEKQQRDTIRDIGDKRFSLSSAWSIEQ
jgi:hypothetical protein